MSCNTCGKRNCYTNPCNTCQHNNDCDCNLHLDWVPHSKGTLSLVDGKCSDTLDLCPGVKACETVTHLDFNNQTGCIVFENEKYLSTDGAEGTLETVCVSEFFPFIRVENLADVDYDDELKGNCYEFIYKKDVDCGDGCKSKGDRWVNFNPNYPGALVSSMDYIRGATIDGCPTYLDKPENCSIMMFSPSCSAPTGEWQAKKIEHQDADLELNANGRYNVVTLDDCGCPVEREMPVLPTGMTAINYQRDSVPDDPDFPWYYGNYNDKINLHLRENAKDYFGKYALKVTVNYGVQAIKSDKYNFNYNWRSLVVPVIEGEAINTQMEASILQNWGASGQFADGKDLPWGTTALRSSFTFIVPKGKEAYLHHEYRVRATSSFPEKLENPTYDGKRVPDIEATLNSAMWPASRLNALQVLIEPTQGTTDFNPTKDEYRDQLDPAVDSYDQAF